MDVNLVVIWKMKMRTKTAPNKNILKINISETDLQKFPLNQLIIDPFWEDLYNAPCKKSTRKKE